MEESRIIPDCALEQRIIEKKWKFIIDTKCYFWIRAFKGQFEIIKKYE